MKGARNNIRGSAAIQWGKARPFRSLSVWNLVSRFRFATAMMLFIVSLIIFTNGSFAQNSRPAKTGAHSSSAREAFTAADRKLVERAIGATCAERIRDPQGSTPIDEMQSRPSLPVNNPDALSGARRADRLLPTTRRLVINAIVQLAKEYELYDAGISRSRITSATSRVDSVKRVKADVDARDNASVALREPRTNFFRASADDRIGRRFARERYGVCFGDVGVEQHGEHRGEIALQTLAPPRQMEMNPIRQAAQHRP